MVLLTSLLLLLLLLLLPSSSSLLLLLLLLLPSSSSYPPPLLLPSSSSSSSSCVWQVETLDGVVQTSTLQASRLKTDLRLTQQEKDALRQEVLSLHKQLQNANNKVGSYQGGPTYRFAPRS